MDHLHHCRRGFEAVGFHKSYRTMLSNKQYVSARFHTAHIFLHFYCQKLWMELLQFTSLHLRYQPELNLDREPLLSTVQQNFHITAMVRAPFSLQLAAFSQIDPVWQTVTCQQEATGNAGCPLLFSLCVMMSSSGYTVLYFYDFTLLK